MLRSVKVLSLYFSKETNRYKTKEWRILLQWLIMNFHVPVSGNISNSGNCHTPTWLATYFYLSLMGNSGNHFWFLVMAAMPTTCTSWRFVVFSFLLHFPIFDGRIMADNMIADQKCLPKIPCTQTEVFWCSVKSRLVFTTF